MNRLLPVMLAVMAAPAFAQKEEDAPIPYDDEAGKDSSGGNEPHHKKSKQRRDDDFRVVEDEAAAREETLAHFDDPNVGVGGELLSGAMLFESSRGALVDPRFMFGARFTWEFGRLIPDEVLRELFFADVTWQYASLHDGTTQISADTSQHYFTLAPAFALPFSPKSPLSFYGQLGVGLNYDASSITIDKNVTQIGGAKFLVQYGVGLRGRHAVVADGSIRLCWRLEVTRLVRGYMHDTFLGAGVGMIF